MQQQKKEKIGATFLLASVLAVGGYFGAREQRISVGGFEEDGGEATLVQKTAPTEQHKLVNKMTQEVDQQRASVLTVKHEITPAAQPSSQKREVAAESRNAEHLTASSTWIDRILEKAEREKPSLQNKGDADWFIRSILNELKQEFYFPTQGEFDEGPAPYGLDIKIRKYTPDDGRHIREQVQKLVAIIKGVDQKFQTDFYKNYSEQIQDILAKAQSESSYTRGKQLDAIRNAERLLEQQ